MGILISLIVNSLETIPLPLLDRMEVISLSGYTIYEKTKIAQDYLVPKQIEENGIEKNHLRFPTETLEFIISNYTSEPGVRNLERMVGTICRRVAFDYLKFQKGAVELENFNTIGCVHFPTIEVTQEFVEEVLGPKTNDNEIGQRIDQPGIAIGLAWTSVGGRVLLIEAAKSLGTGKIEITGHLGEVMKESVMTAIGWIKAHPELVYLLANGNLSKNSSDTVKAIKYDFSFDKYDIHVHCPAAAIPKDGPSAGITIAMALVKEVKKMF